VLRVGALGAFVSYDLRLVMRSGSVIHMLPLQQLLRHVVADANEAAMLELREVFEAYMLGLFENENVRVVQLRRII
jgi:histone H3/H4